MRGPELTRLGTPQRGSELSSLRLRNGALDEVGVSEFDPEITTAWKDNLFRYKSLTLEEVLEQLSARYDVRIITDAGDVGRTRFSGALETRLSVEQALDIVSRQTGMEWSKLDNVYFVTKR